MERKNIECCLKLVLCHLCHAYVSLSTVILYRNVQFASSDSVLQNPLLAVLRKALGINYRVVEFFISFPQSP